MAFIIYNNQAPQVITERAIKANQKVQYSALTLLVLGVIGATAALFAAHYLPPTVYNASVTASTIVALLSGAVLARHTLRSPVQATQAEVRAATRFECVRELRKTYFTGRYPELDIDSLFQFERRELLETGIHAGYEALRKEGFSLEDQTIALAQCADELFTLGESSTGFAKGLLLNAFGPAFCQSVDELAKEGVVSSSFATAMLAKELQDFRAGGLDPDTITEHADHYFPELDAQQLLAASGVNTVEAGAEAAKTFLQTPKGSCFTDEQRRAALLQFADYLHQSGRPLFFFLSGLLMQSYQGDLSLFNSELATHQNLLSANFYEAAKRCPSIYRDLYFPALAEELLQAANDDSVEAGIAAAETLPERIHDEENKSTLWRLANHLFEKKKPLDFIAGFLRSSYQDDGAMLADSLTNKQLIRRGFFKSTAALLTTYHEWQARPISEGTPSEDDENGSSSGSLSDSESVHSSDEAI